MLPTTPTTINPRNHTSKASIVTNSLINSACIILHQLEFALQALNLPFPIRHSLLAIRHPNKQLSLTI
jgi:hypothetical protein